MQIKYPVAFLAVFIGAQSLAGSAYDDCQDAINLNNPQQILQLCQLPADNGEIKASTALAAAILSEKTPFMATIESRLQGQTIQIPLTTDEKVHLFDAKDYLEDAADEGDSQAQYLLSMMLMQTITNGGILVGEHLELLEVEALQQQADTLVREAAAAGNPNAIAYLAANIRIFDSQNRLVDLHIEDITYLQQMAATGQSQFVEIYQDYQAFLTKAKAIAANPQQFSGFELSTEAVRLLRLGENTQKAHELLLLAAQKGDASANYQLSVQFAEQAPEQSFQYLHTAANASHPQAMYALGSHYGCKKDVKNAIRWFESAIKAGVRDAEEELAEIQQYGDLHDCANG